MTRRTQSRRKKGPPIAFQGEIVREGLPFPVVHYPNFYGTFFAFAETEPTQPVICSCAQSAVGNYIAIRQRNVPGPLYSEPLKMAPLSSQFFPNPIAEASSALPDNPLMAVQFRSGLCHRCNLATPTLRYCHEMYGQAFLQHYGWYVNLVYLRLGILPMSFDFLQDVCPLEFQALIDQVRAATADYDREYAKMVSLATGPGRDDIAPDEVTYWRNVRTEDATRMIYLRRRAATTRRALTNSIENIAREEFGFKKVGEGWVNETLLSQLVSRLLPGEEVLRHYRPDWLSGLELDLFIPGRKLGIEYQGQQHFHEVEAWGGANALAEVKRRDATKVRLCKQAGVELVTFDYTEALTEIAVAEKLRLGLHTDTSHQSP